MLHEQNWQLQQSSALIEEQKALCQDWRIIAQYWEIEMQHWQNHMQRWQRHDDSAAGPLMQTNTTASGRRSASKARPDDGGEGPIASPRKTRRLGVTADFPQSSKASANKIPSQLLDPVPPPGPPPGPPVATPPGPPPGPPPSPPLATAAEPCHSVLLPRWHPRRSRPFSPATVQHATSRITEATRRLLQQRAVPTRAADNSTEVIEEEELSPLSKESYDEWEDILNKE